MVQDAMPIFLGAEVRSVPAEVVDSHRAVRNRLISPEPDLAFFGLGRESALPRLARLLFHDHEGLATLHAAREVVSKGDSGCEDLWRRRLTLLGQDHVKETWIVVESGEIQFFVKIAEINHVQRRPNIVGGHKMRGARL